MFACSTRFDQLHPEQVEVVFDALVRRHAEFRNQLEYLSLSAGGDEKAWELQSMGPACLYLRENIRLIHGAAVALFGVHILKRDEFWVSPSLMHHPNTIVVGV